jgi:hypothetical protein
VTADDLSTGASYDDVGIGAGIEGDEHEEDAAAAVVGDAADAENEDDADAMDEDADASRFDLNDPDRHPLTNMPPAARNVEVGHAFAAGSLTDKTLTLGKKARVIVGMANHARTMFHVWGVMGSLNMPRKFDVYVQNFTYGIVNQSVPAGGELSFDYTFEPNERLDTRDFTLALSVFYEARNVRGNVIRGHSTTFFNSTVSTQAGPQAVSNMTFVVFLVAALVAAGGGVYYASTLSESTKRTNVEMGTAAVETDWLEDHDKMLRGGSRPKAKAR